MSTNIQINSDRVVTFGVEWSALLASIAVLIAVVVAILLFARKRRKQ